MRQSGDLRYPDANWFAWMPCLFIYEGISSCDGLEVSMTCNGVTKTVEHDAFNGSAYVDMREYVQGFFSLSSSPGYASKSKSAYAVVVSYEVRARTGSTYMAILDNASTMFVWGYLDAGEVWNERRNYTWFRGYPFFVDVYASASQTCAITGNGETLNVSLTSKGIWHVPLSALAFEGASMATLTCGGKTYTARIEDCEKGVYLRWLDRHGRVCHWLFREGTDAREISASGYLRPNLAALGDFGWSGWSGHRDQKTRQKRLTIGAPFVDSDTFEMMCDLVSSPWVEVMLPSEDWLSVRVESGTVKKSKAVLQEFECTVLFDEVTEA